MPNFYTPEEIAKELKVSKKAIYYWLNNGKLKGIKVGNLWRVTREAIEEFTGLPWKED